MKNVLFLVTGMTPQIITETVWALACDPNLADDERFVPDEIWVLSTDDGLNQIKATLFDEGVFEQFKKDYPIIAKVAFDKNHLCVIQKDGTPLKDLKTPGDNELSANLICQQVRNFTQDDNVRLHVSIAGGRKTMGFYAGYALSLYGRAQDSMSHVLVDSEFESAMGFYYPTQTDYYVTQRHTGKKLNAKDAQIWLANIPFVRMSEAISDKHQLKQGARFSEVVDSINESFKEIQLTVDVPNKKLVVNGKEIDALDAKHFAFFYWFADLTRKEQNISAPKAKMKDPNVSPENLKVIQTLTQDFNIYYQTIKKKEVFDIEDVDVIDIDKGQFNSATNHVNSVLIQELGLEIAKKIKIANIDGKRGKPFHLNVPAKNITIIEE